MAVNPAGYVSPFDGGNPRMVTCKAIESISAGQLCVVSGAADAFSSGVNSFSADDIWAATGASGADFNGVAMQDATSGGYVSLVTRGHVVIRAGGSVTNGATVAPNGSDDVIETSTAGQAIGKAWSNATSGGYTLVELR